MIFFNTTDFKLEASCPDGLFLYGFDLLSQENVRVEGTSSYCGISGLWEFGSNVYSYLYCAAGKYILNPISNFIGPSS